MLNFRKATGNTTTRRFKKSPWEYERQEERFGKLLECLTKQNDSENLNIFSQESVINSVGEFIYKPEEEATLEAYFRRYESIFQKDCEKWPDEKKVKLLLDKIWVAEHEKYVNPFLPRQPGEVTFRETFQILRKILGNEVHCLILVGNISTLRKGLLRLHNFRQYS